MSEILEQLTQALEQRKKAAADASYVASLYAQGLDAILKKIGEEAGETIIAAKNGDARQLVHETADLWFHTLVLLSSQGLDYNDIIQELERRLGTSGIEEKANRAQHD